VGTVAVGLLASSSAPAGVDGLLYGGGPAQLVRQTVAALAVAAFSFGATWLVGAALHRTLGFRVPAAAERLGIDLHEHGEVAYDLTAPPTGPRHAFAAGRKACLGPVRDDGGRELEADGELTAYEEELERDLGEVTVRSGASTGGEASVGGR
jgi:hypothetical protein